LVDGSEVEFRELFGCEIAKLVHFEGEAEVLVVVGFDVFEVVVEDLEADVVFFVV